MPGLQLLLEIQDKGTCTIPFPTFAHSISVFSCLPSEPMRHLGLYVSDILSAKFCSVNFCVFMYEEGQLRISTKMGKRILQVGWEQRWGK